MNIEIRRATRQDTPVMRQLYELYCHDFSEMTNADVGEDGLFTDGAFLTGYWREPNWQAFLVRVDDHWAGFAWVLKVNLFRPVDPEIRFLEESGFPYAAPHTLIEEFFVMRKYRRKGVGEHVAHYLFDLFPGVWQVSEIVENTPAQAFWRKIIERYTQGRYVEVALDTEMWHGPVQVFWSRRKQ
jgi:predicted acetyltransferase